MKTKDRDSDNDNYCNNVIVYKIYSLNMNGSFTNTSRTVSRRACFSSERNIVFGRGRKLWRCVDIVMMMMMMMMI